LPASSRAPGPNFVALVALCVVLAAHAADPRKVVRTSYPSEERSFDCTLESDEFSGTLCENVFDTLLEYDYLARPVKLKPRAAERLPEVSDGGRTYTLRVKPGIYFTPDAAFGGKPRELVAADYVYTMKRVLDPAVRSQWGFLLEGKIDGADAVVAEAKKTGRFDYDRPVAGLQAVDRYTLRIRLKEADYKLPYILAMPPTAAIAREVAEKYGAGLGEHPVGTGPYALASWTRGHRIVLEANPGYREDYFESEGGDDPRDRAIIEHLRGKRLPLVGRIEMYPIEQPQPRWLAFLDGQHDYIRPMPVEFVDQALPEGKLAPNLARRGIQVRPDEVPWITYTTFNMDDPVVGGYTPEKIALRRALCLAYPIQKEIAIIYKHQAVKVDSPIAPGMAGYTGEKSPTLEYDPARAKALLDMYGYVDRDGDGWREMPDGSPLVIDQSSTPDSRAQDRNKIWSLAMAGIGIRMTFNNVKQLPDLRREAMAGHVQSFTYGWLADYPDGEDFLQLFWSKSIGAGNYAMFRDAEFDRLYERVKSMPDTPERTELYRRMVHIVWVYAPWRVNSLIRGAVLIQPWLLGYKKHPFEVEQFRYLDIDLDLQRRARR
jgi:ABC-type transport system substrate-binding protein